VDGDYCGNLSRDDPLYEYLTTLVRDKLQPGSGEAEFSVFRLSGTHEVYRYHEKRSHAHVVGKFYGPRFRSDPDMAALVAQQEYDNLEELRAVGLVGSPHHVVQPLGMSRDIDCVLVVEHYAGEDLTRAIRQATEHRDGGPLLRHLKALAFYLSTQHNRTSNGSTVDFDVECAYFETLTSTLLENDRITRWDAEELAWLQDLWHHRQQMWEDKQVSLHGDATPRNFLFGTGMQVGVIDLERMRRGDRAFDIGRIVGELQHAFMLTTSRKSLAEPYISYFFREYCSHLPDPDESFRVVTARTPFYMGLNQLRIARNSYIGKEYGERLVRQAKRLLRPR
jgi:aminoglycoside phosphotransferase (APT) family kinase protein